MIKVHWDVEELVALIDVYRRSAGKTQDSIDNELSLLSGMLHKRAEKLAITHDEKFRNLNGMKMMYQNVVYIATNGEQGLSATSDSMRIVYDVLRSNPTLFDMILSEFYKHYGENTPR